MALVLAFDASPAPLDDFDAFSEVTGRALFTKAKPDSLLGGLPPNKTIYDRSYEQIDKVINRNEISGSIHGTARDGP